MKKSKTTASVRFTGPIGVPGPIPALPAVWCRKHLTPAERRVVEQIIVGKPTKIVAAELGRSSFTVRNQLLSAMRKLGVTNRLELLAAQQRQTREELFPARADCYVI